MLCERCYRHLLSPPLVIDADSIQCTSLCPTSNGHVAPMSDQEVRFEEVLNVAQGQDEYVNYDGGAEHSSAKSIDFSLFDKNLSVLLKRQHATEEPSPAVSTHSSTHPAPTGSVHKNASTTHGPKQYMHLDSHGIEGHRIRNSRDLTKILRSNSGVSAGSVSSAENNATTASDSKTE